MDNDETTPDGNCLAFPRTSGAKNASRTNHLRSVYTRFGDFHPTSLGIPAQFIRGNAQEHMTTNPQRARCKGIDRITTIAPNNRRPGALVATRPSFNPTQETLRRVSFTARLTFQSDVDARAQSSGQRPAPTFSECLEAAAHDLHLSGEIPLALP